MNVEEVIIALLLLGLIVLSIPWLVRLSLSNKYSRLYTLKLLRLGPFKKLRTYIGSAQDVGSEEDCPEKTCRQLQVRYLSPEVSHSPLRLVPWDARGVLRETEQGFSFSGNDIAGDSVTLEFPSDEVQINYQKGSLLWDGGFSWCVIEKNGEKHFFTSDVEDTSAASGASPEEDNISATGIYQSITKRYI